MSTEPDNQPTAHGPQMSRRGVMRAAVAGSAAAAGLSGTVPEGFDVVQASEALSMKEAAVGAAAGATVFGAAGMAYQQWQSGSSDTQDSDSATQMQNKIYSHAVDIKNVLAPYQRTLAEFKNASGPQQTPFADAAWGNLRNEVVTAYENGKSQGDAQLAGTKVVNEQACVSALTIIDGWNSFAQSVMPDVYPNKSWDVWDSRIGPTSDNSGPNENSNVEPYGKETASGGQWVGHKWTFTASDLPGTPSEYDRVPEQEFMILGLADANGYTDVGFLPDGNSQWLSSPVSTNYNDVIQVTHPDYETLDVLDVSVIDSALAKVFDARDEIVGNMTTYVDNLYTALDNEAVTPADVIGPRDIADQFANASEQDRLGAELAAVGAQVPKEAGYEAKVSHAELDTDRWGWIWPQWSSGAGTVSPGATIAAADYDMAFFGYTDENAQFQEVMLSGDSDLQILDMTGLENEENVSPETSETAASGEVVLGVGESTPEPIRFPADHSGYKLSITGDVNESVHPVSDVQERTTSDDKTEYYLSSTGLAEGETIEKIRIVPNVEYVKPFEANADPTTLDESKLKQQVQTANEIEQALEEAEGGSGGGLFGGSGFLSAGRGMVGGVIVAVLAVFTLSTLN